MISGIWPDLEAALMKKTCLVLFGVLLAGLITLCLAGFAYAQEDGDPISIGTYRTLHSQILDEDRTLLVSLPEGYHETAVAYPVLFILYGGQVRGYFAESVHIVDRLHEAGLIPPLILIGVENVDRYRDNLPVGRRGEPGGAGKFLEFFEEELIPFVDGSYRTKDFRILLGPQAGAAFALYSLMERPGLFRLNIITNPFWNRSSREYLLSGAEGFFGREGSLRTFLFVTCETADDTEATMEHLDRLAAIVEQGKRSDVTMLLNRVEEESDDLIPSPGLREGLTAYFGKYKLPVGTEINNLEGLEAYYRNISGDYGYGVDIPEFTLIRQGGRLEERGKTSEAKILYEYALEHYPHNLNSYHRLAELHRRLSNYDLAIDYYERFLRRRHEPFLVQRLNALRRYISESAAYAVERAMLDAGVDAGKARFRAIMSDEYNRLYVSEAEFNAVGYGLLAKGMTSAAVEVFEMNVEMFPESANAFDSLGEAYMLDGDTERAVTNYMRSLELDPENKNAREKLKQLSETSD
jgi:predicted alpha/beta superfamily hydrolase